MVSERERRVIGDRSVGCGLVATNPLVAFKEAIQSESELVIHIGEQALLHPKSIGVVDDGLDVDHGSRAFIGEER
jgi:hypothetical protein